MKSFVIEEKWHDMLKKLSEKTGKKLYRLLYEAIELLDEKYKEVK